MQISKIGEFGLISRFKKSIKLDSSVIKGPGDDCAVLEFNKDEYLLWTCDMLVEGVDFYPGTDLFLVGRKSIAVSLSDIAACAGTARYCLVSLAIPKGAKVSFADKIFKGMLAITKKYKVNIVGGDISRADKLAIDVSMLGLVKKRRLALRGGAKEKDIIFVTGDFGGSILGKHLKFIPRLKEAKYLADNFKINSMIDVSDGLAQDLGHILEESQVGARIYEEQIPISRAAKDLDDALYSGEDFELIFTLSRKAAGELMRRKQGIFKPIGEIMDRRFGLRLVDKNGRETVIKAEGFKHF